MQKKKKKKKEKKKSSGSFKKFINKNVFINPTYSIYIYKEDLTLDDLQWLMFHKTKPNFLSSNNI